MYFTSFITVIVILVVSIWRLFGLQYLTYYWVIHKNFFSPHTSHYSLTGRLWNIRMECSTSLHIHINKLTQVSEPWFRSPIKMSPSGNLSLIQKLFEVLMLLGQLAIWLILQDTRFGSLRKYTTGLPNQSFSTIRSILRNYGDLCWLVFQLYSLRLLICEMVHALAMLTDCMKLFSSFAFHTYHHQYQKWYVTLENAPIHIFQNVR